MINFFPRVLLKTENDTFYYVSPVDEKFVSNLTLDMSLVKSKDMSEDSFKDKYFISIQHILAFGDAKDVDEKWCEKYVNFHRLYSSYDSAFSNRKRYTEFKSSQCYAISSNDPNYQINDSIPAHHDCRSSWNCLLDTLFNPTHCVIYTSKDEFTTNFIPKRHSPKR